MQDPDTQIPRTSESRFQHKLIKEIQEMFPGAIVLKNDPNYLQGFPDLTILFGDTWAVLEDKASETSHRQPNQEYYINLCSQMSYASFAYPANKEQVLDELLQTFRTRGSTRLLRR